MEGLFAGAMGLVLFVVFFIIAMAQKKSDKKTVETKDEDFEEKFNKFIEDNY